MMGSKMIIEGITKEGKKFRPSDWPERISGNLMTVKNHRISYSPLLYPSYKEGLEDTIPEMKERNVLKKKWIKSIYILILLLVLSVSGFSQYRIHGYLKTNEKIGYVITDVNQKYNEKVIEELKKYGRPDIMVIVGGVIPAQDYQSLFDTGAVAVFGPGTKISEAAIKILDILIEEGSD